MIPNKLRESKRVKALKLPKNLERLYREGKCRECAVVVTRMDFAKILGKFTKVKIQYESSKTSKTKPSSDVTSPNARLLKSNENGLVPNRRKAYNQHPVKELLKKNKIETSRFTPNILKESNRLKKPIIKDKNSNYDNEKKRTTNFKEYGIVFEDPLILNNNNEVTCKISLSDLLSQINDSVLPSEDWSIDFFPKKGEPKDDKVYDRIAAELEDLMYNEKPKPEEKPDTADTKADEFPSIMDILNDNSNENKTNDQSCNIEFKSNLESSDVEAMLLGKSNTTNEPVPPTPMDVDQPDMGNLIEDVNQLDVNQENIVPESSKEAKSEETEVEDPQSPSLLDETLHQGIEAHLPINPVKEKTEEVTEEPKVIEKLNIEIQEDETEIKVDIKVDKTSTDDKMDESKSDEIKETKNFATIEGITHLVFKKTKDGVSFKTVTCPKNLRYDIELDGKSVEFIGAPKFISSLEDLQVLLQIVNESKLDSLHVLH